MSAPGPASLGVPLLGSLASSIASAILSGLTQWVISGAAELVRGVGAVLLATTSVPFNIGFTTVFQEVRLVGLPLVAIFMSLAVIRAIIHQDLADLGRMLVIRLPLALLGSGVALEMVALFLKATDDMSGALFSVAGLSVQHFTATLSGTLLLSGGSPPGGFVAFLLAVICGVIAFLLWIELVIRSSAIAIAALFIPLALAGSVWSASASWGKRLAEILGALILSKLVIAGVFALAISEIGDLTGIGGLIQGAALLLLATMAPWTLLRLVPSIESGLVAQLEGIGGRARSALTGSAGDFIDYVADAGDDVLMPREPELPDNVGRKVDTPEFRALVAHLEETLPPLPPRPAGSPPQRPLRFDNLFEPYGPDEVHP